VVVTAEPLYFDDLHVGQRITSSTITVDEMAIIAFGSAFDPQPFHTDPTAARGSVFGGLIASGWHTAALSMRLLVTSAPPIAGGLVGAGGEIAWPAPTRAGDILHIDAEVIAVTPSRSRPDRGIVTLRSETRNQRKEVVQILTAKLVVPRRPAEAVAKE
jgi:acyl dehydratase